MLCSAIKLHKGVDTPRSSEYIQGMFIRRTTIKSRKNGEPYYTYRLVESVRTKQGVRQRTLINLGKHFNFDRELWPDIAGRIKEIISPQKHLSRLSPDLESVAQSYAAQIIQGRNRADENGEENFSPDYHNVDTNTLELTRPRSVGIEHVACNALKKLRFGTKMKELGLNKHQLNAAIGTIVGRIVNPGSELSTYYWLQNRTGLGELTGYDYETMKLARMYNASDMLLAHKKELERHLYEQERSLFEFDETITLYDLTNTYFEGSGKLNTLGAYGRSKEKRSDCPLVTLGLVLDSSGFPKRSEVFSGNVSEPGTLEEMIKGLEEPKKQTKQMRLLKQKKSTIIMDAGIATEDNIAWLKEKDYPYIVVSRKRHREFDDDKSVLVKKESNCTVKVCKVMNKETDEVELYCHSTMKEKKEKAIYSLFATRFEEALNKLESGLHKKGCVKKYDKVIEKLGRLKQRYSKASKNYKIVVKNDKKTGNAVEITYEHKQLPDSSDSYPGVYCLRTNQKTWNESTIWRTYTMLTDLESVFRSLKSELGLRPVFHQKTKRISGHLFITLLAYHLIHTIRYQLKKEGIDLSWSALRRQLRGQDRITVSMKCKDGETVHIRKSTRPEPRQHIIYDALELSHYPGRTIKKIIWE